MPLQYVDLPDPGGPRRSCPNGIFGMTGKESGELQEDIARGQLEKVVERGLGAEPCLVSQASS